MLCRAAREIPPSGQAREIPPRPRSRRRGNARLEARRAEGGCGRSWRAPGESSVAGGPNQGAPPVGVRRPGERRPAGRRCPATAFRPLRTGTHSCRGPILSSASRPPRPLGNLSSEKRSPPGPPRRRLRREMFRASRSRPRALPSSGTGWTGQQRPRPQGRICRGPSRRLRSGAGGEPRPSWDPELRSSRQARRAGGAPVPQLDVEPRPASSTGVGPALCRCCPELGLFPSSSGGERMSRSPA